MKSQVVERERWAPFFLARLERLCHLEERLASPPGVLPDPRRLVNKAIFSTYCACVQYGVKAEAERLLTAQLAAMQPSPS